MPNIVLVSIKTQSLIGIAYRYTLLLETSFHRFELSVLRVMTLLQELRSIVNCNRFRVHQVIGRMQNSRDLEKGIQTMYIENAVFILPLLQSFTFYDWPGLKHDAFLHPKHSIIRLKSTHEGLVIRRVI